eukprot:GEZU01010373.1.p2 GENE.GEZU01010373.1~~GEZU01010373.1.p2  ORF type:complete len:121 (-),score=30.93 GEZU01010373.1:71-403(-)
MSYLTYGFAAMVAVGGIVGFVKRGSFVSMGAGLTFGAILFYAGQLIASRNPAAGYKLSLAANSILGLAMGARFMNSGKFMPAGLVAGLSILMALRDVYALSNLPGAPRNY